MGFLVVEVVIVLSLSEIGFWEAEFSHDSLRAECGSSGGGRNVISELLLPLNEFLLVHFFRLRNLKSLLLAFCSVEFSVFDFALMQTVIRDVGHATRR